MIAKITKGFEINLIETETLITVEISLDVDTIYSENSLYGAGHAKGRRSWLYKKPLFKEFAKVIKDQLSGSDLGFKFGIDFKYAVACYDFVIKDALFHRDVTNMLKATEDAIFAALFGKLDNRVAINVISKRRHAGLESEKINATYCVFNNYKDRYSVLLNLVSQYIDNTNQFEGEFE